MALTPNSSSAPFCTPEQMLRFYDASLLGQLASDTGVPVTPTGLLGDPVLLQALMAGAGDIESACSVAGRYQPSDLHALAGTNAGDKVAELNADLAFARMRQRRGYRTEQEFPQIERAFELLGQLRLGERIFSFAEIEAAGVGSTEDMGNTVTRRQTLTTTTARRYFGVRGRDYRFPRVGG